MSTNDPPKPGGESRSRREDGPIDTPPDDTGASVESGRGSSGSQDPRKPTGKADFGSFVSSTARSSADLFKTPGRSTGGQPPRRSTGERTPARPSPEGGERDASATSRRTQSERPRRYWRDSVAGAAATRASGEPAGGATSAGDERVVRGTRTSAGDGDGIGGFLGGLRSAGGSARNLLGIVLGALLLLLVIGFLVIRGGDDGGDDETPEPSALTVLGTSIPSVSTESPSTATPGAEAEPTEESSDPTDQPTEERRRGGDNQLDGGEDAGGTQTPEGRLNPANADLAMASPPAGDGTGAPVRALGPPNQDVAIASTPAADSAKPDARAAKPGPVAKSCPSSCLLRVAGSAGLAGILTKAETRPSFAAENWSWVVVSAQGAAYIEANVETILVSRRVNTLNAYVVRMPEGQTDDAVVASFGTIVDSVDRYRMVEVAKVPARVSALTDLGFEVFKMAPAPTGGTEGADERIPLADIDIGELLNDVDPAGLETTIRELQATSSTDGSGVGSRHYSLRGNAMASEYLFQRMEALGMKVWYEDFIGPDGLLLVNVVGELPGADPGTIYSLMAHFDSMSTDTGNAPGADDNATGIAASLEIARILAGYELNHPVRLVFVNAEEVGIIGSDIWARKIVADAVPIDGVFNLDAIGSDRQGTLIYLNSGPQSAWMSDLIAEINSAYGLGQELVIRQNPKIVADDNKLRDQGIEAVLVARELYGFSSIHHTPNDLIEVVSIENTLTTTQLILLSVATLVR